jgi:hypothetical protein
MVYVRDQPASDRAFLNALIHSDWPKRLTRVKPLASMTKHVGRGLEIDEAERIEAIRHARRDVMLLHVRAVAGLAPDRAGRTAAHRRGSADLEQLVAGQRRCDAACPAPS